MRGTDNMQKEWAGISFYQISCNFQHFLLHIPKKSGMIHRIVGKEDIAMFMYSRSFYLYPGHDSILVSVAMGQSLFL